MLYKNLEACDGRIGAIRATNLHIVTVPGSREILQRPHRSVPRNRDVIAGHVQNKLYTGIIDPESSDRAIPGVLNPIKDGTLLL